MHAFIVTHVLMTLIHVPSMKSRVASIRAGGHVAYAFMQEYLSMEEKLLIAKN